MLNILLGSGAFAAAGGIAPNVPDAIIDLATREGVALVKGGWRYCDARIIEIEHRRAGPDLKASGPPGHTNDVHPRAGAADFDDRSWTVLDPTALEQRRSTGRLAFGWYRLNVTIPDKVGAFDPTGATVVFEIVIDDYAEVWVDGRLPQVLGQAGGPLVAGWNVPSRLVIGRDVRPGQKIQLAIFAANGPLSDPPANFVWVRSATLDFYRPQRWNTAVPVSLEIDRKHPALDSIVSPGAQLGRVATGFTFTEGPVWVPAAVGGAGATPIFEGYLLFSDPNRNVIYRCTPDGDVSVYRTKSGYKGADIGEYRQPGSNGLTLDAQGRLTICEHGHRRVTRLEPNGVLTVLADRYEGRRLNSPNDLVYRSDGTLYFTDPVFGLPKFEEDPRRESPYTGVYCLIDGTLKLVGNDLSGPNGLALSPDEQHLYVGNWDEKKKIVMRYEVSTDGALSGGRVFADLTAAPGEEAIDGVKVDERGNVYVSGPGGLWIFSPDGTHLGTLRGPEHAHNLAWGDRDGRTLYWAAQTSIYRLRMNVAGVGPVTQSGRGPAHAAAAAMERDASRLDAPVPGTHKP
ncbi:MAG: SMP-30/gluconolactonase/LRE family protein [Phycisphaerales bacterium]|nr:MAG: SMP-30/gluconolactonase/LRE family protein [Phycisphaerales bacterium]